MDLLHPIKKSVYRKDLDKGKHFHGVADYHVSAALQLTASLRLLSQQDAAVYTI